MNKLPFLQKVAAEGLGTMLLLAAVVGSGVMGERLSAGNDAIALLANTLSTGAALVVLITIFAPLSGAHFNPAVTLYFALKREIGLRDALSYIAVQILGAVAGVWLAHAMFAMPIVEVSHKLRDGPAQGLSEFVATFGLLLTIAGGARKPDTTPALVGLYIAAAYWFTASTSFANPAVTLARSLTDSFSGVAPSSIALFVSAQAAAVPVAVLVLRWLFSANIAFRLSNDTRSGVSEHRVFLRIRAVAREREGTDMKENANAECDSV